MSGKGTGDGWGKGGGEEQVCAEWLKSYGAMLKEGPGEGEGGEESGRVQEGGGKLDEGWALGPWRLSLMAPAMLPLLFLYGRKKPIPVLLSTEKGQYQCCRRRSCHLVCQTTPGVSVTV